MNNERKKERTYLVPFQICCQN